MGLDNFLSNLGDVLDQQFYTAENHNKSAQLGSFSNKYDKSAQRSYTEQGYFRNHAADNVVKQLDILTQQPEATVLIKKRAFSSLAENFRPDLMDKDEALFLRATKILFRNKCRQIAAYERLTKIAQVSTSLGEVDYHLLPLLFGAVDALGEVGVGLGKFGDTVNRIRSILSFNTENQTTSWAANANDNFRNSFGEGTGVIEFTNVNSISTTTNLHFAGGSFSLTFTDPYNLMKVKHNDVEAALSELVSLSSIKSFNLLDTLAKDTLDIQKRQLNLVRAGRGVNGIRFLVEPGTFIGKRVRAIIDGIGFEINFESGALSNIIGSGSATIDPLALFGAKGIEEQGLTEEEISLFSNITAALYNSLSLSQNSKRRATTDNTEQNQSMNRLRQKLRLHYQGKHVIQPMDTISIFINSKKKQDIKITSGLQSALTGMKFLGGISNLAQGINDNLNAYKGYSIEKAIFVGEDFPNPLWLAFRSQFVSDKQGACVFTGVVETATGSYGSNGYRVEVGGGDNAKFFSRGIINRSPSMDVYNGALFDPLTPFKQSFDSATGKDLSIQEGGDPELLDENKKLFKSAFVKVSNGPLAGSVPTERGYFNKTTAGRNQSETSSDKKPFYDPEGLVYRWKEGIASNVLGRESYRSTGTNTRGQSITADPFAGQDIMNVISLMITGEPYNYATFYKATTKFNTLTRDPITGRDGAGSYFRGLRSDIKNNNAIYGNFVPFKRLTMDEATFEKILGSQIKITSQDSDLQRLTAERAKLADRMVFLASDPGATATIKASLSEYDALIQQRMTEIYQSIHAPGNPAFKVLGNDVSYESSDTLSINGAELNDNARRELRRKTHFLTRRLAWKVRANEDQNLFIVDDAYDKDYDIQAFEKSITDFSLYKSEYTTAAQQITDAANKLQLEIFCNTQGHIEIRNPKYNSLPSSVFTRMLRQKDETGIQVFPQFLQDLFVNQLTDLYKNIEVIEDQIRLYCYALDNVSDDKCIEFIRTLSAASGGATPFAFITSPTNGRVDVGPDTLQSVSNPEDFNELSQTLSTQSSISGFSTTDRAKFLKSGSFKSLAAIQNQASSSQRFSNITARLAIRTGQTFSLSQEFGEDANAVVRVSSSNVAVLGITNKIANLLSQRQQAVKVAANAVKNLQEGASLRNKGGAGSPVLPSLTSGNKTPKILEHMIEDEEYDDLGVGSKSRYIIKNHDVISYSIGEKSPAFTAVNVVGKFGDNFITDSQLPSDFAVEGGGNRLATAVAVDYDLWRMYGISQPQSVDAPFLHNPETQLAPYAVSILNKARKEVNQGSINIVGNEFQQPGEVIYLENEDTLYYVDSVSHSFVYGGNFGTSMILTYGHNPGEYIPTPLDVVGKILYKTNQSQSQSDNRRQGNAFNQQNIGAIVVGISGDEDIFSNYFGQTNRTVLDQVINSAAASLSQQSNTFNPALELRVFYNSAASGEIASIPFRLASIAADVKSYLIGAKEFGGTTSLVPSFGAAKENKRLISFANQISVLPVNGNPTVKDEFRFPSRKAFYLARETLSKIGGGSRDDLQTKVDKTIHSYIIDFWITYDGGKK